MFSWLLPKPEPSEVAKVIAREFECGPVKCDRVVRGIFEMSVIANGVKVELSWYTWTGRCRSLSIGGKHISPTGADMRHILSAAKIRAERISAADIDAVADAMGIASGGRDDG